MSQGTILLLGLLGLAVLSQRGEFAPARGLTPPPPPPPESERAPADGWETASKVAQAGAGFLDSLAKLLGG